MPLYESVFIARQDISAGQVDTLADEMEKIITDSGGSVARREYWGLRNLAYRMKKNRKGHYILFNLDAPSEAIQEMERNLRLHEDVLRYITIRLEALRDEASPMVYGKGERDRAERRGHDDDEGENKETVAEAAPAKPSEEAPAAEEGENTEIVDEASPGEAGDEPPADDMPEATDEKETEK
ncbi:MAG: 30S ribosomal protein S6 [Candidatus Latescibacterota bacterium]